MAIVENDTLPTTITPYTRKMIQDALKEMSASMLRVESEKDLQKDIGERIKEECGVSRKDFNRLAKIYHASNLVEEAAKNESFLEFAEAVMAPIGIEQK